MKISDCCLRCSSHVSLLTTHNAIDCSGSVVRAKVGLLQRVWRVVSPGSRSSLHSPSLALSHIASHAHAQLCSDTRDSRCHDRCTSASVRCSARLLFSRVAWRWDDRSDRDVALLFLSVLFFVVRASRTGEECCCRRGEYRVCSGKNRGGHYSLTSLLSFFLSPCFALSPESQVSLCV